MQKTFYEKMITCSLFYFILIAQFGGVDSSSSAGVNFVHDTQIFECGFICPV